MVKTYTYKLIRFNKPVGSITLYYTLYGQETLIPETPILKQEYNKKIRSIKVPIVLHLIEDNGTNLIFERYLDVSKLTKRQLNVVKKFHGL